MIFLMQKITIIKSESHFLVGCMHIPRENLHPDICILFINGKDDYRIGAHGIFLEAAREFSNQGYHCLRIDFSGKGDSEGTTVQDDIDKQSIKDCIEVNGYLRNIGFSKIIYLGMCGGGHVALLSYKMNKNVESLIFWSASRTYLFLLPQFLVRIRLNITKRYLAVIVSIVFRFLSKVISKLLIPKIYFRNESKFKNKKTGLIVAGELDKERLADVEFYHFVLKKFNIFPHKIIIKNGNTFFSLEQARKEVINKTVSWLNANYKTTNPAKKADLALSIDRLNNQYSDFNEIYGYLEKDAEKIFYARYGADNNTKRATKNILICSPVFEEQAYTYSFLVKLARELSREGACVVKFDYRGWGESGFGHQSTSLEKIQSDIHFVADSLLQKENKKILIGLRLGGLFALKALEQRTDIEKIILIEPILDVKKYINQLRIKNRLGLIRSNLNNIPQENNVDYEHINGYEVKKDFLNTIIKQEVAVNKLTTKHIYIATNKEKYTEQEVLLNLSVIIACLDFPSFWHQNIAFNYLPVFNHIKNWAAL